MDSGDTGTEEIAKKHPNPSPPCGGSPPKKRTEGVALSVSSPLPSERSFVHEGVLGELSMAHANEILESGGGLRSPSDESECARPRGSARTSLVLQKFVGSVRFQISSRNALQKQRQTRVNGSLRGGASRSVDGAIRRYRVSLVTEETLRLNASGGQRPRR
jgi:hypothetical protein